MAILNYCLIPPLPKGLEGLAELGLDLRWSWSHATDTLWNRIDPELWNLTRNPWLILQSVSFKRLKKLAGDPDFTKQLNKYLKAYRSDLKNGSWFRQAYADSSLTVAYFSMEFGLSEALPLYSGGLGVLAGDYLKTASDLGVPIVGIGLLYQQGYFRQIIDAWGNQQEFYPYNNPVELPVLPIRDSQGEWLRIKLDFPGREVKFRVWEAKVGRIKLYLLDSNDPTNNPADRGITAELYGGRPEMRLEQEIVLGIGGWKLLRALGIKADICHLNEGHAAFAVIERIRSFMEDTGKPFDVALAAVRGGNIFTTHTSVAAGFDRFPRSLVEQYLGDYAKKNSIDMNDLLALGRQNPDDGAEPFNMAYLAIHGSIMVNGVSQLHGKVSRRIFQPLFPRRSQLEVPVTSITNGVHMPSWDSAESDAIWSNACGKKRWLGTLSNIDDDLKRLPDETLWSHRNERCKQLIQYVRDRLVGQYMTAGASQQDIQQARETLNADTLTLGFARRFATYKRPNLLLHDVNRFARIIGNSDRPVQLVVAGKAHPEDQAGKNLIKQWSDVISGFNLRSRVIFLADYDMSLAEHLVQGVDLWINTPRRPWEASGTSGMKVLVNGGLNLSELDGWWAEAYRPEVGWAIGDGQEHDNDPGWDAYEAGQLYNILEQQVIPAFYDRDAQGIPKAWVQRMRLSMAELTPRFSTNRMMRQYVEEMYLPAAESYKMRIADKAAFAANIANWQQALKLKWTNLRFGTLEVNEENGNYIFKVQVYTPDLGQKAIMVQLYAELQNSDKPEIYPMKIVRNQPNPDKSYSYTVTIPAKNKPGDYTPRIIPAFKGAFIPIEANHILWYR